MGSMAQSLFAWVGTLDPFVQRRADPIPEDFKDGVMLAKILKEVVDPDFFKDLKTSSTDATPLITLSKRMKDYLSDQVGHTLPNALAPNIPRIMMSGDVGEISRLLQLLLVCAVNSPRRQDFIGSIRTMETIVQTEIVAAIQEIMDAKEERSPEADDLVEIQLKKAHADIAALHEDKERLSQECHDLTQKMSQMAVEKVALLNENEKLQQQLTGNLNDPESLHISVRVQEESRREIEQLRERNYELEALVDEFKVKNQDLQKQISEIHFKLASAASAEEEVVRLKDEMDSLREQAAKAAHYEKQMKILQKKLEEMADLKQTAKLLEEKNLELMKSNFTLSDENKRIQNFKNQMDALKKDLTETQQQLSQEKHKANKANFDCNQSREKLETMNGQVQALTDEKTHLQEMLDELRLTSGTGERGSDPKNLSGPDEYPIGLLPASVRQKLITLELENKKLQGLKTVTSNDSSSEGSKIIVEQLRQREEELDKELLAKNQELIDTKAEFRDRLKKLEDLIVIKDEELKKKEQQYKKCMEKAQSVILQLEPRNAPDGKPEELDKARSVRDMEDKLLQSAFYHYGIALHHKAVEARNRTFLGQHRQNVMGRRRNEMP